MSEKAVIKRTTAVVEPGVNDPLRAVASAATGEHGAFGGRIGRSRFLALAGGTLFGFAAAMAGKAQPAWAACGSSSPCEVYGLCCCCSGTVCCQSNCVREEHQCGTNGCWTTCNGAGNLFQCCDWLSNNYCICRTVIGGC